ncbi:ATP-binding protein [Streptomyces sp. Edi4]|uniref:ATP-binding protein n=1 Tax=Streptomyces sp. Edi4 TaxID=3162527 RepID=UPI003305FB2B
MLLPGEARSAALAREFVRAHVTNGLADAGDDHVAAAVLITSELVTNAIRYGTEPGDILRLVLDANDIRTRVEVHDPVRRRPRVRPESEARDRGRGLIILDALCPGAWGVTDIPFGKSVWAEVEAR